MLAIMPIKGRLITADAIQTHRAICAAVIEGGGDYILPVKDNQPTLRADIEAAFAEPEAGLSPLQIERRAACLDRATTVDKGHGRIEKRTLELTTSLEEYLGDDWPGCRQVFRLQRERRTGKKVEVEVVFGITSLSRERAGAAEVLGAVRAHWGIENGLHGRRDGTLKEDAGRVRKGSGPQVMAVAAGDGRVEELDHLLVLLLGQGKPGGGDPALHVPPREVGGTRVNPNPRMKRP